MKVSMKAMSNKEQRTWSLGHDMCGSDLSYNLIVADQTNGIVLTGHNEFVYTISISTVLE